MAAASIPSHHAFLQVLSRDAVGGPGLQPERRAQGWIMRQMLPHLHLIFGTDFRFRLQGFIGTAFVVKSIPTLILVDVKTGKFDWHNDTNLYRR